MTAQIYDSLTFAGKTFSMGSEPLSPWLARRKNRHLHFRRSSTAVSRGYGSAWKVTRRKLYLVKFRATLLDGTEMTLAELFPGSQGEVLADWYSGALVCPMGELLHYEHTGYASTYEYEMFLWFIEGTLVETRLSISRPSLLPCPELDDTDLAPELDR